VDVLVGMASEYKHCRLQVHPKKTDLIWLMYPICAQLQNNRKMRLKYMTNMIEKSYRFADSTSDSRKPNVALLHHALKYGDLLAPIDCQMYPTYPAAQFLNEVLEALKHIYDTY
jgi:hypothetical protein